MFGAITTEGSNEPGVPELGDDLWAKSTKLPAIKKLWNILLTPSCSTGVHQNGCDLILGRPLNQIT